MTTHKLPWIFAVILVFIAAAPLASAQSAGGGSLSFVLINAAIVGFVLFMIQAFLLPGKDGKEKTAIYVGIIVGSLMIGFLFGQSGFIWQGYFGRYFNFYVLVNAAIIATVIYIILGYKVNLNSKEGNGGYILLIFIISMVFAVNIGQHWIWQLTVIRDFAGYLFGADGLLNPSPPAYRLWVFISSFVLMAYFFVAYLNTDKKLEKGGNIITYAISLLLAASMTRAGIGFPLVVKIAELVFFMVLADALKGQIGDGKYEWGLAFLIVGWSSSAVTAAYGKEYEGIIGSFMAPMLRYYGLIPTAPGESVGFGPILLSPPVLILVAILFAMDLLGTGKVKKFGAGGMIVWGLLLLFFGGSSLGFGKVGTMGMYLLLGVAGIIGLFFIIGRGERRADGMWRGLKRYGLVPMLRRMRSSPNSLIKWILKKATLRDPYFEGELPPVFKDIRAELMILMNYQTRLHTYFGKRGGVAEFGRQAGVIEGYFETSAKTYDDMKSSMNRYRFGGADLVEKTYGWSNNRQLIALFFDMLKKDLEGNLKAPITPETRDGYLGPLTTTLNNQLDLMKRAYAQFKTNAKRFGLIHRLRSLKIKLLDLLALGGVYKHSYRFANENSLFEKWDWKIDDDKNLEFTKRDNEYEKEKEKIIESIKKQVFIELRQKKQKEMVERIYKEYYAQTLARFEPVFIEKDYDDKMRQEAMKDIMRSIYLQELKNRDKEIEKEALSELESEGTAREIIERMPRKYKLGLINTSAGELRHEVNIKGFVLEDIHKIEVDENKIPYIKKVKIEDIEDFPGDSTKPQLATFEFIIPKILSEWDFLLEDLRFGTFHPFSRSHIDYTTIIDQQKSLNFNGIGKTKPDREQGHAAFDLEALKISGKFVYWGRRNYWDTTPELKNYYPTISTIGLSRFITSVVRLRVQNNELENRYLSYWVWDTSRMDEPFTSVLGKESEK